MLSLFQIDFAAREFVWAVCGGLLLAFGCSRTGRVSRGWRRFAERPWLPGIVVGLSMFAIQAGVAARYGWPVPALHDEFSYLLAADTFASGRATNPTTPAWEFFETYHVLSQPSYQSKYPPGNGLILALGQVLTGRPIVGVWLCLAAATSGLFWMLRGWFASRWALLGAVILICNWPVTKLWGQTYYGGAPALLGGVLVYGALARLLRRPGIWGAICVGCGLLIWAVTRPYEGLIASVIPLALLSSLLKKVSGTLPTTRNRACFRRSESSRHLFQQAVSGRGLTADVTTRSHWLRTVALPLLCVLACGGAGLGWYHQQVTGSPWKWPYRLYEEIYTRRVSTLNTLFAWTPLGTRERTIPSLEYQSSAAQLRIAETKPVLYAFTKAVRQWWFHVGLLWTVPCYLGCVTAFRQAGSLRASSGRSIAWSMVSIALVGIAILLQRSAGFPHYAAPIQPLVLLLIIQGLRSIRVWRIADWRIGTLVVSWLTWSCVLFFVLPLITGANRPNVRPWSLERDRIQRELEHHSRPSLVIVKYGPSHSMHEEWVYNRADLQRAPVVWARQLEASRMPQLWEMFPGRDVWIVEPDQKPVTLRKVSSGKMDR